MEKASSDDPARCDVVIIGAGLNGLAAALALGGRRTRMPLQVTIIDRADPRRFVQDGHDTRASALTAATQQMLQALGVWPAMASEAQPMRNIIVTDGTSAPLLRFLDEGAKAPAVLVENRVTYAALLDEIAQSAAITLITGVGTSVTRFGPGLADVQCTDDRHTKAPLIIAADGRNSPTRQAAHIACSTRNYGQSALTLTVGHELPHHGEAEEHFHPQGVFAVLPLTGNRSSLVWTETPERAADLVAMADGDFLAALQARFGPHRGALSLLSPRQAHPLALQVSAACFGERLALIGDAAHIIHPLAGLGLNLGFKDVAALADCVMDAARLGADIGSASVLQAYARWRRFDTYISAGMVDGLNRLFANDNELLKFLRQAGLKLVDHLPSVKRGFAREAAGLTGDLPRLMRGLAA